MIFVTGPLFAGKKEYIRKALGLSEEELRRRAVTEVQDLAFGEDCRALADRLAERADTVIRVCCGLPQLLKGELP